MNDKKNNQKDDDKRHHVTLGEDIAFGIQQTVACWATDFIDPFVSAWFQNKYGQKDTAMLAHAMKGEVAGDSVALFAFIAAQKWAPAISTSATSVVEKAGDGLLDHHARTKADKWAAKHGVATDSQMYDNRVQYYKHHQAYNFVRASMISVGSVAVNVGVQKWSGNKNTLATITLSKLVGAAITMGAVMGARIAAPDAMRNVDTYIEKHVVKPTARFVRSKVDDSPEENRHQRQLARQQKRQDMSVTTPPM